MLEYRLTLGGVDCAIAEWNPNGKTLAFALHGWLDNLATFESIACLLKNVRIIAIDFPGHGHSAHIPPGMSYHFYDGINLIDDLALHFNQPKVNLIGHSMGAAVSLVYAGACPDKVAGLVAIESLGPLTANAEEMSKLLSSSVSQRIALKEKKKPIYSSFSQALEKRAIASEIDYQPIEPIVERGLDKVADGYTWRADSRLRITSPIRLSEQHLTNLIEKIEAPVCVIEADGGYLTKNEKFQARKPYFKKLSTHVVSEGHHAHLQEPEACALIIDQFFESIG